MFHISKATAKAEFRDQSEVKSLVRELEQEGYRGALSEVSRTLSELTGCSAGVRVEELVLADDEFGYLMPFVSPRYFGGSQLVGDVFFCRDIAFILQPQESKLALFELRHHSIPSRLSEFAGLVAESAAKSLDKRRLRGMSFEWEIREARALRSRRRSAGEETPVSTDLETKDPEYTCNDLMLSKVILKHSNREFLMRLAQALGKARTIDTLGKDGADTPNNLLDVGLIRKEYLVTCKHDSHTICTISDPNEVIPEHGEGPRCASCSRPLKDEHIQEIHALTDVARQLLKASHWMSIWVTEQIVSQGVDKNTIQWNVVAGGDELDIMVEIMGTRVFFELKDRDFGLGDAYAFATRVARYEGDHGIVITLGKVADEAKGFFNEQSGPMAAAAPIHTIEGTNGIESDLPRILDGISRSAKSRIITSTFDFAGPILDRLTDKWIDACSSKISHND